MDRKQVLGLIGSMALIIGAFMPIMRVSIVGSINYFHNGRADGAIVVALGIGLSYSYTNKKIQRSMGATGLGGLGIISYFFHWVVEPNDTSSFGDNQRVG